MFCTKTQDNGILCYSFKDPRYLLFLYFIANINSFVFLNPHISALLAVAVGEHLIHSYIMYYKQRYIVLDGNHIHV